MHKQRNADAEAVFGRDRDRVYINAGVHVPEPEIEDPSVWPYPVPLILDEPEHRAERVVYESFLRGGGQPVGGMAYYSVTLPLSGNARAEIDFLAVGPEGMALVEVKGGIVHVDSPPGQGASWRHTTRAGGKIEKHVKPAQLFRATDFLKAELARGLGMKIRNFAQMLVFPDTSMYDVADKRLISQLFAPDRDFPRVVFAEELESKGMWAIVNEELRMPERAAPLAPATRQAIARWAFDKIRAQPREPEIVEQPQIRSFSKPSFDYPDLPVLPPEGKPVARKANWTRRIGIALALAVGLAWWSGREAPKPAVAPAIVAPSRPAAPDPSSVAAVPAPPLPPNAARPAPPREDALQAALTRALSRPDERIPTGGTDWVRVLGPIAGKPDCHLAEITKNGAPVNVMACRSPKDGWNW